jgi:hypothetical protein
MTQTLFAMEFNRALLQLSAIEIWAGQFGSISVVLDQIARTFSDLTAYVELLVIGIKLGIL